MRIELNFIDSTLIFNRLRVRTLRNVILWISDMLMFIRMWNYWFCCPSNWWILRWRWWQRWLHLNLIKRLKFSFMSCDRIRLFRACWKHLMTESCLIIRSWLIFASISKSNRRSLRTSTFMRRRWRSWDFSWSSADSMSTDTLMRNMNFGLTLSYQLIF